MIRSAIILSMAVAVTVAFIPDCTRCSYENGIGFIAGQFCNEYYVCIKSRFFAQLIRDPSVGPDRLYRYKLMCCPEGTSWNNEHLTCERDSYCIELSDACPENPVTTNFPCPMEPDPNDSSRFFTSTYENMHCGYGQEWRQEYCACIYVPQAVVPPGPPPCLKLLHYEFSQNFNSDSCYNFAVGEPYGAPYADNFMLCLDGEDSFVSIPFLNNWFAWNPVSRSFTFCFFVKAGYDQNAGVFSTNCEGDGNSLLDLWLEDGYLVANLGGVRRETGKPIPKEYWSKVCVTFDHGFYKLYVNAVECGMAIVDPSPINSHNAATLGFVPGLKTMHGYFDDFCFWSYALSADEIQQCFDDGPSSDGQVGPAP